MVKQLQDKSIAVLCGGISQERDVSLRSGENVYNALKELGYKVEKRDPKYDAIDDSIDIAFLALHGPEYEDGQIQQLCESKNIAYTGSGVLASQIGMSKLKTKQLCEQHQILIPRYRYETQALNHCPDSFLFPLIVKPLFEGSSIDVFIIDTVEDLEKKTSYLVGKYNAYLCETFIAGQELTVSVVENPEPLVLPILECVTKRRFYDYTAKYTEGLTDFILPAKLSEKATEKVRKETLKLFKASGCKGMARIDFRFNEIDGPCVLEINTIPGLTNLSDLPAQAKEYGWSFPYLIEIILKSAIPRLSCQ